jgi:hypothetical protein
MADSNTGLWATLAAAVPGLGALGWAIFKTTMGEEHPTPAVVISHQDSEDAKAESARALLDEAQKEWFDGMRSDLRDARADSTALRKDRDRGWDLARAWRDACREERHARNNLLQKCGENAAPPLPGLEDILGVKSL